MKKCLRIGPLTLEAPLLTAPMAGFSDKSFRILAHRAGAALTYTEMISAQGVVHKNRKTMDMLNLEGEEGPVAVQLFGRDPEVLAEAARLAVAQGAQVVDFNMGCPAPKVVKNGEGAALMRDLPRAQAIISAMVEAARPVPVTVKMRKGWGEKEMKAVEAAQRAEEAGAAAVVVHGRTGEQGFSGRADWECIRQVKEAVYIPVIGNGDIKTPEDAVTMMELTGCDGVMVGRSCLGNPWLLTAIRTRLENRPLPLPPSPLQRIDMALEHLELALAHKGERGVREMRKVLLCYLKGLPRSAEVKRRLLVLEEDQQVRELLLGYREYLEKEGRASCCWGDQNPL